MGRRAVGVSGKRDFAGGASARYLLLGSAVFLTAFGLVMIYSASSISAYVKHGSSWYFFVRQGIFIVASSIVAWFVARYDYRKLAASSRLIWAIAMGVLIITYGLGVVRGGARRWIPLGIVNLQPSEFAKIASVLVTAMFVVEWRRRRIDTTEFLKHIALYAVVPALLILFQPDLGTAVSLVVAVAVVLYLGGVDMRWIWTSGLALVSLAVVGILLEPYRMKRVLAFLNPWADPKGKGYQAVQALLAFGTGGIKGVGLGLSRQKFFYLPEAHTDFIFAIIGEELGLLGTLAIVVGFGVLVYAGIRIAMGARDSYGRLVAGGLTGMIAFQAFLNMGTVTGLMPITGKPLPFVSYGGSSVLVTMICMGLLLSVSEYGCREGQPVHAKPQRKKERTGASHDERRRDRGAHLPRSERRGRPARRR